MKQFISQLNYNRENTQILTALNAYGKSPKGPILPKQELSWGSKCFSSFIKQLLFILGVESHKLITASLHTIKMSDVMDKRESMSD